MSDTVFVSGASGFVGSELVPQLLRGGYRVRGLARSERTASAIARLGAEPAAGDLANIDALTRAMAGCGLVILAAARLRAGGSFDAHVRDNVTGTEHMLSAARRAGVHRFVMVGASMCLLGSRPVIDADESWPLGEPRYSSYVRTKTLADRMVLQADRPGFATCVVRPGWVWGPGDPQTTAIVDAARKGRMRLIDGGRHPIVTSHIDNTVQGIVMTLQRGAGGQAYYVFDDGVISIRDFIASLLEANRLPAPTKSTSRRMAWILGSLMERSWAILRRPGEPPVSRLMAALNGGPFIVSDAKARRELGYSPVITRDEALVRLAAPSEKVIAATDLNEAAHPRQGSNLRPTA